MTTTLASPRLGASRERRRAAMLRVALCTSLLGLAGCGDEPPFKKLFTTEHFVYYVEEGATPPCEGTGAWLERYYRANAEYLGAELPGHDKIEYFLAASPDARRAFGCPPNASCAPGTAIAADRPVFPHEIVHANAALLGNRPPALFEEGLAEVLGCDVTEDVEGPIDQSVPLELLVETSAFLDYRDESGFGIYGASASFVRFLLDELGKSRFLSFYVRAPFNGGRDEIASIFRDEMGMGLDEAFSAWRARPAPYRGDLCLRRMECDPSTPAWTGADLDLGCGPSGAGAEALVRFEVPADRVHLITAEPARTEHPSLVVFYRCGGGDPVGSISLTSGYQFADGRFTIDPTQPRAAFALDTAPGAYVMWAGQRWDAAREPEPRLRVDMRDLPSPMRSEPCAPAEAPLAIDHDHETTLASRGIERGCQGPWCPGLAWDVKIGAVGGALEVRALVAQDVMTSAPGGLSPSEVYLCEDACPVDASGCEILSPINPGGFAVRSKRHFAPGSVVHLGATAPAFAGHFTLRLRVHPAAY